MRLYIDILYKDPEYKKINFSNFFVSDELFNQFLQKKQSFAIGIMFGW